MSQRKRGRDQTLSDHEPYGTGVVGRRRRDPTRRRREIVDAAAEIVAEVGAASLTHRQVAARAGVPLGSTTQYFATLDALRAAALERLADEVQLYVDEVVGVMNAAAQLDDGIEALGRGLHEYLSDAQWVRADAMLSAASVVDPQVRPLTDAWFSGLAAALTPHLGAAATERVAIFIGGAAWHTALNDGPPPVETVITSLRALLEPERITTTADGPHKRHETEPNGQRDKDSR
ncbi:TetR family transcriptional regulator [Nocardioides sp. CER19]|uniref:TetR/AcrR family transcriptional regulator n=1 Tax=Nocardioides sp. CER19 TaxID=3038538 RepID=UPI00244AFCB1|nr:TetR family transcriptional regulator [Nocardioides sp. CER19]MDH2416092.1 TetR family transcriptional regulator [Nocardioides sp. CER19]